MKKIVNDPIFVDEEQNEQGTDEDILSQKISYISILINEYKYKLIRNLDEINKKLVINAKDNISNNFNIESFKEFLD